MFWCCSRETSHPGLLPQSRTLHLLNHLYLNIHSLILSSVERRAGSCVASEGKARTFVHAAPRRWHPLHNPRLLSMPIGQEPVSTLVCPPELPSHVLVNVTKFQRNSWDYPSPSRWLTVHVLISECGCIFQSSLLRLYLLSKLWNKCWLSRTIYWPLIIRWLNTRRGAWGEELRVNFKIILMLYYLGI